MQGKTNGLFDKGLPASCGRQLMMGVREESSFAEKMMTFLTKLSLIVTLPSPL